MDCLKRKPPYGPALSADSGQYGRSKKKKEITCPLLRRSPFWLFICLPGSHSSVLPEHHSQCHEPCSPLPGTLPEKPWSPVSAFLLSSESERCCHPPESGRRSAYLYRLPCEITSLYHTDYAKFAFSIPISLHKMYLWYSYAFTIIIPFGNFGKQHTTNQGKFFSFYYRTGNRTDISGDQLILYIFII